MGMISRMLPLPSFEPTAKAKHLGREWVSNARGGVEYSGVKTHNSSSKGHEKCEEVNHQDEQVYSDITDVVRASMRGEKSEKAKESNVGGEEGYAYLEIASVVVVHGGGEADGETHDD